jgi:hypothetical protein
MAIQPQAPLSQFAKSYHPYKAGAFSTTAGAASTVFLLLILVIAIPTFTRGPDSCSQVDLQPDSSKQFLCSHLSTYLTIVAVVTALYVTFYAVIMVRASAKARRRNEETNRRMALYNDLDYTTSQNIQKQLTPSNDPPSVANPSAFPASLYEDMGVGEISRHFDQRMQASISGWLNHELSFHGWGAGLRVGNVGLGLGQMGLSGQSQVNLNMSGTMRDDLLSDSFVAVFERTLPNGMTDTLRVLVPPEPALHDFLSQFVNGLAQQITPGTHCQAALHPVFSSLASLQLSVSRVSDLLSSILRQPAEKRPTVKVIGVLLSEGIMLGEAIQFAQDARWYNLFPISRCLEAKRLTGEAQAALASIPLPPLKKIA